MHYPLALFEMPGLPSMLVIAALGLLIFGKRLPEVGKSLGKGIVEFKKGLKGIEEDVETQVNAPVATTQPQFAPQQQYAQPQYGQPVPAAQTQYAPPVAQAPLGQSPQYKFDPYTGKPIEAPASQVPPTT